MAIDLMKKLKGVIVQHQFVNCYSPEFSPENRSHLDKFLSTISKEYGNIILGEIHIDVFVNCNNEEQEANALQALINCELFQKGIEPIVIPAISIADMLQKWSKTLDSDKKALLSFYFFQDLYNENEKNILRSIRKACRSELSAYLRILLVSTRPLSGWHLFPESNLDERFVTFFEC